MLISFFLILVKWLSNELVKTPGFIFNIFSSAFCFVIELLSINSVKIFFSGNSVIVLILEDIDVVMTDLGKPWSVKFVPKHEIWLLNYPFILNKTYY